MKSIKLYLALPMLPALLLSSAVSAHTALTESVPADRAVLTEAPAALELAFSADVQLVKLDIATSEGAALETDFAPAAAAAKSFSIPLPALQPAGYAVTWTILGADGHRVEGELSFLVDAVAHEPADSVAEPGVDSAGDATSEHDGH